MAFLYRRPLRQKYSRRRTHKLEVPVARWRIFPSIDGNSCVEHGNDVNNSFYVPTIAVLFIKKGIRLVAKY